MNKIKNINVDINTQINFIRVKKFLRVNNRKETIHLQRKLKSELNLQQKIVKNFSTGMTAKITSRTINKIIYPSERINIFDSHYIDNLNASFCLKELFENAVYIDTLKPMKSKKDNINEQGYHHFVAPLKMKGECYKAFITVRQKINSNILYVVSVKLFKFDYSKETISVKELIDNVSIWNYDKSAYNYYSYTDFVGESFNNKYLIALEIIFS